MTESARIEISCEEVWQEVSNYLDAEVDAELRERMRLHFRKCAHCAAILDGARNVVQLVGDDRAFSVPAGFGERLRQRLRSAGGR